MARHGRLVSTQLLCPPGVLLITFNLTISTLLQSSFSDLYDILSLLLIYIRCDLQDVVVLYPS